MYGWRRPRTGFARAWIAREGESVKEKHLKAKKKTTTQPPRKNIAEGSAALHASPSSASLGTLLKECSSSLPPCLTGPVSRRLGLLPGAVRARRLAADSSPRCVCAEWRRRCRLFLGGASRAVLTEGARRMDDGRRKTGRGRSASAVPPPLHPTRASCNARAKRCAEEEEEAGANVERGD